ncbi:histidine kinase [Sphingomonas sp. IC-56]|uniref:EF-hand domain-containing protein n=1 Tax=Sphingomonas sp. IC-56 TaxID=2898529 RepID=UPI001E36C95B|nr:histidine kinase [Sphingomonas sp. IC-56]MCD2323720.1 histidine kinase [Sphingomonas sp. IC-56]
MWRYVLGLVAVLMLATAAFFLVRTPASSRPALPAASRTAAAGDDDSDSTGSLPDEAPSATAKTREEKRFNRYDKDRNDSITREEYLASRRKAYAKLDSNGDGRLSFEEWAAKTTTKFTAADADRSGALTRTEFTTTAPKRKAKKPPCACKPAASAQDDGD